MAFDHTRVNPDEIQSVLSQMNTRAAELVQLLQLLKNQMEALNFTWQGSSSIVLIELMSSWDANVQGILEVLSTYNKHLSQTASAYQDLDSSISRGFRDS